MIYRCKAKDFWGREIIEYVCSCCGNVMPERPKNCKCTSCKRT